MTDDKEIVSALRRAVVDKVGQERFALWIGSPEAIALSARGVVIRVSQPFRLGWIRKRLREELAAVCRAVLGRPVDLHFELSGGNNVDPPASDEAAAVGADRSHAEPTNGRGQHAGRQNGNGQSAAAARRFSSLESFVVGDANRVAHTAAQMVAGQLGQVTPLFFYGPNGVGKTHLLEGIVSAVRRRHASRCRAIFLSAEQFTTYFISALRHTGLPQFRARYRDLDLLVVDDVQFFAGKRATLVEFQHTVDTLLRARRQLVLAADRPPAELSELGPELVTRLSAGLVCAVQPPDEQVRLGILQQWCAARQYDVPQAVLEWMAAQLAGDARQLSGALNRLHATSLALGCEVTLEMAQAALGDLIAASRPTVSVDTIERVVCEVFGIDRKTLRSPRRSAAISQPRMLAMWLARKYTRAAYTEISEHFGRRSHSTVISADRKVQQWLRTGKTLRLAGGEVSIQEAIRRVESRLRAG